MCETKTSIYDIIINSVHSRLPAAATNVGSRSGGGRECVAFFFSSVSTEFTRNAFICHPFVYLHMRPYNACTAQWSAAHEQHLNASTHTRTRHFRHFFSVSVVSYALCVSSSSRSRLQSVVSVTHEKQTHVTVSLTHTHLKYILLCSSLHLYFSWCRARY